MSDNFKPKLPPEGINNPKENNLILLLKFTAIACSIIFATLFIFNKGFSIWAKSLTFKEQTELFKHLNFDRILGSKSLKVSPSIQHPIPELRSLLNELWMPYQEDEPLTLKFEVTEDALENAYMNPAGVVVMTSQLIKNASSRKELTFILCHEIGHFYHKHGVNRLGEILGAGMINVGLALAGVNADLSDLATSLSTLTFSRIEEKQADEFALSCMNNKYGDVIGATEFFKRMKNHPLQKLSPKISLLSSHPLNDDRIEYLNRMAKQKGYKLDE